MTVTVAMAMTIRVVLRASVDCNEPATRRGLRWLRWLHMGCIGRHCGSAFHECDVGRTGGPRRRRHRTGVCAAVEDGLLAALEAVVELSCARGDCGCQY